MNNNEKDKGQLRLRLRIEEGELGPLRARLEQRRAAVEAQRATLARWQTEQERKFLDGDELAVSRFLMDLQIALRDKNCTSLRDLERKLSHFRDGIVEARKMVTEATRELLAEQIMFSAAQELVREKEALIKELEAQIQGNKNGHAD